MHSYDPSSSGGTLHDVFHVRLCSEHNLEYVIFVTPEPSGNYLTGHQALSTRIAIYKGSTDNEKEVPNAANYFT